MPSSQTHRAQKAALVTGGAVRLGKAISLSLAHRGYDVALHYHSSKREAQETAEEIRACGVRCELFQLDLANTQAIPEFVHRAQITFSGLEVVVNSASAYRQATIMETDIDGFEFQMAVNLRAPFFLTKAFAKLGGRGHIINILDNKIAFNQYQYAAYVLSKKALAEFTKIAAVELAPDIRVNGIAPGVILPAASRSEEYITWRVQGIPMKTRGRPDDIGRTVIYLLENPFLTGQIIYVDGGESLTNTGRNAGDYDPDKI